MPDTTPCPATAARPYETHVEPSLAVVPRLFADVLTSYSHIPSAQQAEHITRIRDRAYAVCPYPCIGSFRYLGLDLAAHPAYAAHVLGPLVRAGAGAGAGHGHHQPRREDPDLGLETEPLFLDVGTCFGQDVRKLIHDGAPAERIYASDVSQDLIDCGFDLFRDDDRLSRARFLCPGDMLADVMSSDVGRGADRLAELHGRVTILHLTTVFHLFPLEQQKTVAGRCLRLLRKDIPPNSGHPALILGGQVGSAHPGNFARKNSKMHGFSHVYRHNVQSWQDMWVDVAARAEWRDRIANLDVRSRLVKRVMDREAGTISFPEPSEDELQREDGAALWHQFEVRVMFRR
ncbi:hypothetical protein Micbo1qcDRAFT_203750 [Microdochium bolleyi]|uniref:Methyltransferase domain-containing protein n=1 Tax=Microdochium bolleyi TaxID=196109 RepID=A0A136J3M3_9PEZI|nr:hypothetical protein Micbo1qcDRAFT_203750 [Microdochium bolleyi]